MKHGKNPVIGGSQMTAFVYYRVINKHEANPNMNGQLLNSRMILIWYYSFEVQVNLFQKHSFLNQLTHNMTTDCTLNYHFST